MTELSPQKLRGGYYTPKLIADFICNWAITDKKQKVLEPSCGDGNFIESAINKLIKLGVKNDQLGKLVHGIELIKEEANKTRSRVSVYGNNSAQITNSDFFTYILNNRKEKYDVIIGNPPFIRYQNFPEEHRINAFKLMGELGMKPNKLTNIWAPFLVIAANSLSENGKLGMVIPSELFQVKYAAETRLFLSNFFSSITIVTFKKLVFSDIQQEVVLLLCEKDQEIKKGIRVVEVTDSEDLENLDISMIQEGDIKSIDHNSEKWTKYFLDESEIQLLRRIKKDERIKPAGKLVDVDVGIVTGRNDFFVISQDEVRKWNLNPYVQKIVGRSNNLKGISFKDVDFKTNSDSQQNNFLFLPPNDDFDSLPQVCKDYIKFGEEQGYNKGYKCRIRKKWYITPSVWIPDFFILRQVDGYSKIILNETKALSTDTIHRGKLLVNMDPKVISLSFLNSLTFAFSEIMGRSYGGGVLTFEPTEVEELPLPVLEYSKIDFNIIDSLIQNKKIEEAMDIIDKELLINQLGFKKMEVEILRNIWKKLSNRRKNRKGSV